MLAEKSQFIWVPTRRLAVNIVHTVWALIDKHAGVQITIVSDAAEKFDRKVAQLIMCRFPWHQEFFATALRLDFAEMGSVQKTGQI